MVTEAVLFVTSVAAVMAAAESSTAVACGRGSQWHLWQMMSAENTAMFAIMVAESSGIS